MRRSFGVAVLAILSLCSSLMAAPAGLPDEVSFSITPPAGMSAVWSGTHTLAWSDTNESGPGYYAVNWAGVSGYIVEGDPGLWNMYLFDGDGYTLEYAPPGALDNSWGNMTNADCYEFWDPAHENKLAGGVVNFPLPVPEPASLMLLAASSFLLLSRRSNRSPARSIPTFSR